MSRRHAPAPGAAGSGEGRGGGWGAGLRIAGGAEAGQDLPPDRIVPVAERAPAGDRGDAERAAAERLVLAAEEHLGVLPVRPRREAGVGQEVAGGPLPHVPDELPHAGRAAGGAGPGSPCPAWGPRRPTGTGVTARWPGRAVPPSPTRPRSAAAGPPTRRTPAPRTSTRASPARRAAPAR